MKKNKKIPNTPKYKFGGFPKLEQGLKDYGLGLADQSLGMLGAGNVIKDSQYSDTGFGNFMKKGSAITGEIGKVALPIAANIIAPGSGKFVSMGQQAIGQFNPQDPSQYDEQGNPINPNMQTAKQAIGMAGQIGGMAGGFMGKYGGQMKYAMGGMNKYPGGGMGEGNGQVELDENSIAPNGQFTQFNEPSHDAQNSNQPNASLAPGEKIFSAKLKPMGSKKSFADLNKSNNTNREDKLFSKGNLDPKSEVSLKLTMMAKMKNSDVLFNMQEQLKKDKVAAYAKKMGVQLPSMDNEQMEPQDMSEQSEGEYKYGGIHIKESKKGTFTAAATKHGKSVQAFASQVLANKENYSPAMVKKANFARNAAKWKHEMGGVQLPYYNTDNAGNPIYAMGGGYPAMTNPYYNFKGSIPMYEDGGNMREEPKGATKVSTVTPNYTPIGTFGNKSYFDKQSDQAIPGGSVAGSNWENSIINRLQSGVSIDQLVKGGHGTAEGLAKYAPYYKPVYIETFDNNTTTPSGKYDQRIDRKQVYNTTTNNPYIKYFDYPDANAGYSKATRVAVDAKTGKPVDPIKSFDAKGNYVPSFTIDTGRDYYENTIKSSVPGTNPTNLRLQNTGNLRKEAIQTGGFKYGGQMPKYEDGATVPYKINITDPNNLAYQYNQNMLTGNSYAPSVLPWNRTNDVGMGPNGAAQKYIMENPTQQFQEATTSGSPNITQTNPDLNNKPNWMDIVGKGVNFAAQNIGNIYDLSRKDAPLQSYERATAKYLDPTQARMDEQYAYRQANKAIPGLVGGSAGAAMNLLGANRARTSTNIGRINKEYENVNAQIANQLNQYNTEIAYREAEARAKDAAMKENIRSQALHGVGTAFGQASKSGKQDKMDQKTLEMYKQYYNNPQFRAALKKAGYDV